MRRTILAAIAALVVLTLSACGGSGNTPPPTNPTVTVSPATANVQEGSQQQFTATVTNTSDTAVTWQVNGVTGGNATVGTISSTGLYTAPAVIPSPASVTVTAALQSAPTILGNSIVTITAVQFSTSSLKGSYVFSLSGIDAHGAGFYAVGAVVADGNGNISGGEEDLNDASSGYFQATAITGSYTLGSDGRGVLTLNSSLGSFAYAFAMRALNNAGLNEIDNNVINATGNLEQQTATGVVAPSGNYAYGYAGVGNCGSFNAAGIFALSSNTVGGIQDLNCGGTITQTQPLTGTYTGIDGFGRGTGVFSSSTGNPDFIYYVVSANRYRFMCPDGGTLFLGTADLQTQSSFAITDVTGNYVVSTSANTQTGNNTGVSYTLIQFNATGGNISTGYYDVNDSGIVGQANLGGAFSVASNGRVSGSFTVNSVALPFSMYLSSPSSGYYLDQRTTVIGGGNVYAQASAVTTNAAWAGSYATKQFGYFVASGNRILPGNSTSVSGQISADGNGNLAGTLDFNDPSNVYPGQVLQGTYSVGSVAPGRTIVAITTPVEGTRNYVAYIVDQTRVLLLETDTNLTSGGDAIRQF
jgi:hypothetical protein